MMLQKKHSNFLFILLFSSLILFSCAAIEEFAKTSKPQLEVEKVRFVGISFDDVDLAFDIKIKNPNPLSVNLAGLDYDFQIDNSSFLKGQQEKPLAIAANGESSVEIPLTLTFKNLYNTYAALKNKDSSDYKITSTLFFDLPVLGRTPITVTKSGNLPLIKMPDVKISSLNLKNLNLTGANLELKLDVQNPNSFHILLNQLAYDFKINGQSWAIGKTENQQNMKEKGSVNLTIPIFLNFLEMGRTVYNIIQGDKKLDYQLDSQLDLKSSVPIMGEVKIPITHSGQLNILK